MSTILEHDYEEAPGLPEALPSGERLLWQGGVDFRAFLKGSFHVVELSAYFGILLVLHFGFAVQQGTPLLEATASTAGYVLLAAVALGLVTGYAWWVSKTTVYTVSSERIVIRTGIAMPISMNLPFNRIESADLRLRGDGSGDIAIVTERDSRVSWLLLWPMVKPWRLVRVQPMLRGLLDAEAVARTLGDALQAGSAAAPPVSTEEPAAESPQPLESTDKGRFRPYPTIPLAAIVMLVVVSFIGASWSVLTDSGEGPEATPLVAEVQLFFEDQSNGSVVVRDAVSGSVLETLDAGTNGFVRATMRTLVTARRAVEAGAEVPFTVGRTDTGRVLLVDPVSGREIDLRAFGPTNVEAFARFLDDARQAGKPSSESAAAEQGSGEAFAYQPEESTP